MKILHYKRYEKSSFHIHANLNQNFFYIPTKEIVLYKEKQGTFGGTEYSLTKDLKILEEAKLILENKILKKENVIFSDIKEIEYSDSRLLEIIKNADLKKELDSKVKDVVEDILKKLL